MTEGIKIIEVAILPKFGEHTEGKWYYGAFGNTNLKGQRFKATVLSEQLLLIKVFSNGRDRFKYVLANDCAVIVPEYPAGAVEDNR